MLTDYIVDGKWEKEMSKDCNKTAKNGQNPRSVKYNNWQKVAHDFTICCMERKFHQINPPPKTIVNQVNLNFTDKWNQEGRELQARVAYRVRDTSHVGRFLMFLAHVIDPVCKTLACSKCMPFLPSLAYWASCDVCANPCSWPPRMVCPFHQCSSVHSHRECCRYTVSSCEDLCEV